MENVVMDASNRLSSLSIIIDDFDSARKSNTQKKSKQSDDEEHVRSPSGIKPYTRQSSDAAIRKIMEEAEERRSEFCKLLDEHDALVANLKRIEAEQSKSHVCNQSPIMT